MSHPRNYPALVLYGLNVLLSLVVAFGAFSTGTARTVEVVATGVVGLIAMFLHRPVHIAAAATLFSTVLVAIGGFGIHLDSAKVAALTAAFSMLAAWFTHQQAVPVAAAKAPATRR